MMQIQWKLLVIGLLLSGCVVKNTAPTNIPTIFQAPTSLPALNDSATCRTLDESGMFTSDLKNTHILYQGFNTDTNSEELWVVSLGDGSRKLLAGYPTTSLGLGWLQDGKHFIIVGTDTIGKVWLGNIDGSPPHEVSITNDILANFQPYSPIWSELANGIIPGVSEYNFGVNFSPDGKKAIIWSQGDTQFVLVDQASHKKTVIAQTSTQETISGSWTADSNWFVYSYLQGTPAYYYSQIHMINEKGLEIQDLTTRFERYSFGTPIISPDGKKIVFPAYHIADTYVGVLWLDTRKIELYGPVSPLASSLLERDNIIWSPDSMWVAFFTEWEQVDIRVIKIDTGQIFCVTQDPIQEDLMDWR